jgi:PKD repeat protein
MNSIWNAAPNVITTARRHTRLTQAGLLVATVALLGAVSCADGGVTEPLTGIDPVTGPLVNWADSSAPMEEKLAPPPTYSRAATVTPLTSASGAGSLTTVQAIPFAPERGPFLHQLQGCRDCIYGPAGGFDIGFSFHFYGTNYTKFWIGDNGFVAFTRPSNNACCNGTPLPMAGSAGKIDNMIALAWLDLEPAPGQVSFETRGEAPRRKLIVNYNSVLMFNESGKRMTSQLILYEGTNHIEIHTTSLPPAVNHMVTQGAENANGTEAIFVPGRVAVKNLSLSNDAVRFSGPQVNAVPVAFPGGNAGTAPNQFYEGIEGTTITFKGSGTDLDNDQLTYSWDFNSDGQPDATTAEATWTYADDGTHSAQLTVNDSRGGVGHARVDVVIENAIPQVNAGEDMRVQVGETVNLSGTFNDPGANDSPWGWTWNIAQQAYLYAGNTSDRTAPVLGSHRFCRAGVYSAKLTVVDKDGDSGEDETIITVDAIPVEIDVNPNQINLNGNGHGMLTVRIFSNATVNAAALNPDQVKLTGEKGRGTSLARTGGGLWMWNADNDENGDGRLDAVAQFRRDELIKNGDLTLDTKELRLTAPTGECGDVLGTGAVSVKVNAKDKSAASALQAKP